MRHRSLLAMMLLLAPSVALAGNDDQALALAKDLLDRGAALFDTRDAAAMADTYVDDAELMTIKRDADSDRVEIKTWHGRAAIEKAYADIFKDRLPEHRSRNTVEEARFLRPDVMLIRGRFAMNREQGDTVQFVQIRVTHDGKWKIASLQLLELPKPNP
jgi:uncharacterized protein (TIGR02246 family)